MWKIKFVFRILWELPQAVAGHFLFCFLFAARRVRSMVSFHECILVEADLWWLSGVSLWPYIILTPAGVRSRSTVKHEYGHTRQSLIFGPLYLVVIGLPSVTWNILTRLRIIDPARYYKRWPEDWADRLGGVERRRL